jgi:hypothetical protein
MSLRATGVRRALGGLAAALLLPALLVAVTPSAASAASCDLVPNTPWLSSDGWAVYLNGSGSAYCDGPATVQMLIREDVGGWFDRTVTAGGGGSGDYISRLAPCGASGARDYYVELRVDSGGRKFEEQSGRFEVNASCG